jgi:hypothetical protein
MADQTPGPGKPYCIVCAAFSSNLLDCTRCRQIKYCSQKCQHADYKIHKTLCKSVHLFQDESRPSPQHFRAIVFPEHGEQPRFEWLHRDVTDLDANINNMVADITNLAADIADVKGHYFAGQNHRLWVPLDGWMLFASRTRTRADGSIETYGEPNQSLVCIDEEIANWCKGPLVVLGQDAQFRGQDLTTTDLRHIIDRLKYIPYENNPMNTGIRGVRANCLGELDILPHKPHIEAVEVQAAFYLDPEPQTVPEKVHISFLERGPRNVIGMKAIAMPLTDLLSIPCVARAVPAPISR